MQRKLGEEAHKRGDLVRNDLGRMVMSVVHKRHNALVGSGEAQRKFRGARCKCLNADAEYLRLNAGLNKITVVRDRKDLLDRILISEPRSESVGGNVFVAVADPDVHNAGDSGLLSEILGNAQAGLSVADPELSGLLIGAGQSQTVLNTGAREECRIKIKSHMMLLRELDPFREMPGFKRVTVRIFAFFKDRVACVNIDLLCARSQRKYLLVVGKELLGSHCLSGIIARGLDTAGQRTVLVKSLYIVKLPAVKRHRYFLQFLDRRVGIDAELCVFFLCFRITHIVLLNDILFLAFSPSLRNCIPLYQMNRIPARVPSPDPVPRRPRSSVPEDFLSP